MSAPRVIEYCFESPFAGQTISGEMEFPDGTPDDEVEEAVAIEFGNQFSYGWSDKP